MRSSRLAIVWPGFRQPCPWQCSVSRPKWYKAHVAVTKKLTITNILNVVTQLQLEFCKSIQHLFKYIMLRGLKQNKPAKILGKIYCKFISATAHTICNRRHLKKRPPTGCLRNMWTLSYSTSSHMQCEVWYSISMCICGPSKLLCTGNQNKHCFHSRPWQIVPIWCAKG